mmetsp:Transcript_46602/g.119806  ORF Transcript_46602/g.119806 Transcript_46602/m.119806 type:complete len:202 (+) Transcript_46602:348-953(+)
MARVILVVRDWDQRHQPVAAVAVRIHEVHVEGLVICRRHGTKAVVCLVLVLQEASNGGVHRLHGQARGSGPQLNQQGGVLIRWLILLHPLQEVQEELKVCGCVMRYFGWPQEGSLGTVADGHFPVLIAVRGDEGPCDILRLHAIVYGPRHQGLAAKVLDIFAFDTLGAGSCWHDGIDAGAVNFTGRPTWLLVNRLLGHCRK